MRKTMLSLILGVLTALAHAAPEDLYGIPGKTYCLKDICIGDAISDLGGKLIPRSSDFVKSLPVPLCSDSGHQLQTKKEANGSYFLLYAVPAPALAASDPSTYYRISAVHYISTERISDASRDELAESLVKRMNLAKPNPNSREFMSLPASLSGLVKLKNEAAVYLKVGIYGTELTTVKNKGRATEINTQPGCAGKAPKL